MATSSQEPDFKWITPKTLLRNLGLQIEGEYTSLTHEAYRPLSTRSFKFGVTREVRGIYPLVLNFSTSNEMAEGVDWNRKVGGIYVERGIMATTASAEGSFPYERLLLKTTRKLDLTEKRVLPPCEISLRVVGGDHGQAWYDRKDIRRYLVGWKEADFFDIVSRGTMSV